MQKTMFLLLILLSALTYGSEKQLRVGIVGGGPSGVCAAWLLDPCCQVTIYEKEKRLGGHACTVPIHVDGEIIHVDAGFEFFSKKMYPRFSGFLDLLRVQLNTFPLVHTFYKTDGSHTIVFPPIRGGNISWESLAPSTIFEELQFKHLINSAKTLIDVKDKEITLQEFADTLMVTDHFKQEFLYPFLAGSWGFSLDTFKTFAAYNPLKYLVLNQSEGIAPMMWNEIVGGTSTYIKAAVKQLKNSTIKICSKIKEISYKGGKYFVLEKNGKVEVFDHLILATPANESKKLLENIPETGDLRSLLNKVQYQKMTIAIHGDYRFMPEKESDWSIANIRYNGTHALMTFYKPWLKSPRPIFKSNITYDVRPQDFEAEPMPKPLYALLQFWHPIVNVEYFDVQKAVQIVNGNRNLWMAGILAWDEDSHESAINSALFVAEKIAPQSERIALLKEKSG